MCDMCLTEEKVIGVVCGEWYLAQATKASSSAKMEIGDYCLTQGMSATFVFNSAPVVDPMFDVHTDEQYDAVADCTWNAANVFAEIARQIEPTLICDPLTGYLLYRAALGAGYDPEIHGYRFSYWLTHMMGSAIAAAGQP